MTDRASQIQERPDVVFQFGTDEKTPERLRGTFFKGAYHMVNGRQVFSLVFSFDDGTTMSKAESDYISTVSDHIARSMNLDTKSRFTSDGDPTSARDATIH